MITPKMSHIYEVIYDLSVDLVTFDLGLPLKVKSRSHTFQGAIIDCNVFFIYIIFILYKIKSVPFDGMHLYAYTRVFVQIFETHHF